MTVKTFSTKSNAKRALTKAIAGVEAFVLSTEIDGVAETGFACIVDLFPSAGKEIADALTAKGMSVNLLSDDEDEDESPAERELLDSGISDEEHQANVDKLTAQKLASTDSDDNGHAQTAFAQAFREAGGWEKRGLCKALRTVAASWTGKHKEFVDAAKALGLNGNNASAEYYAARKGR